MVNTTSGITPERLKQLLALHRKQQEPSPVNPGATIADDIRQALKEEKNVETVPIKSIQVVQPIQPGKEETLGERLARIRAGLGAIKEQSNPGNAPGSGSNEETNPGEHREKPILPLESTSLSNLPEIPPETTDKYGNVITYNDKQKKFIEICSNGESAVLIGPAGTGKTTCQKGVVSALIENGKAGILQSQGHKHLSDGTPGIVICSYTRRAVANIRKNVSLDMQGNCITIHKLLEYQPVYFEVIGDDGETKTKMAFEPSRGPGNPLPDTIKVIAFEEGSMLGIDLYKEVIDACPHNPQLIFLGDIQQLPPVFGPAILGFKLLELPVVELTEVYRQALESPIIRLAHRILSGSPIPAKEYPEWTFPGQLRIRPWKKKIKDLDALNTVALMFCGNKHIESNPDRQATGLIEAGEYDPEEDMILIPFNKACGTDELNKKIAHYLSRKRNAEVHQIIAGFNRFYFSVGDKVLFDKEDATITKIEHNPSYSGVKPLGSSKTLDYWGFDPVLHKSATDFSDDTTDFLLAQVSSADSGDRVHAASHIITLNMNDSDAEYRIDKAGDINSLLLGYALTVHKSQGSEWRKVFCIFHQSHATMLQRELLYTAVTRAREELFVVCEPETFTNGIRSQRVKGDTLAEKAEYFKGRKSEFAERIG